MRVVPVILLASAVAAAAPRELPLAELGWPATTKSALVRADVDVVRTPGARDPIGKLAAGSRVAFARVVAGPGCAYVELVPSGYACTKQLAPSDAPPESAIDSARVVAATLARAYFGTGARGATAYAAPGRGAKALEPWRFIQDAIYGVRFAGGAVFVKTGDGYVAANELEPRPASRFEGVAIVGRGSTAVRSPGGSAESIDPTQWPFAWVAERAVVRAAPSGIGAWRRELPARARVTIAEQRDGYARIADGEWIALADLHVAQSSPRPKGVHADERWIDVDLDQQVLVAYAGDTPVYATLVSTGLGASTPTSLHRIHEKRTLVHLTAPAISYGSWDMPDTPFYMDFRIYYALHGAYWHDAFGTRRSHGCVNLAPRDAGWLFDWTLPHVPAGWADITARGDEGTPVRIRDRAHPDPPWTDYMAPPPVPTRDTPR
jgi:lipoprotein-anchoring transpeptidase ErfK/SrfK